MADTAAGHDEARLRAALEHAHHPTLALVLVHLTGDTSFLTERYQPAYEPIGGDPDGGLSEEAKAELRDAVFKAMLDYWETGKIVAKPDRATIKRMMDYCATQPIPDEYVDFATHELALDGRDNLRPGKGIRLDRDQAAAFKVLIIGAGMSGIASAIALKEAGVAFEILEKNPEVGGTWHDNTYPGCRVDNPNHLYSYSFEADHAWPQHFSTQDQLLAYFKGVAKKHDLYKHIRFNTEVLGAAWDEQAATWTVRTRTKGGKEEVLVSNAVISAVGQLNQPKLPDIEGRDSFKGPAFHSARWDHSVKLDGKRVGVIGTGCSAVQFVPEIAPKVEHLTVFQRTAGWLAPTPDYHDRITDGKHVLLADVPFYQVWYRFFLFIAMADGPLAFLIKDPTYDRLDYAPNADAAMLRAGVEQYIREQTEGRPDLTAALTPNFHMSGKRSIRDNGVWAAALKRDNVTMETSGIDRITETGIRMKDGRDLEFDALIYGTGFKASDFLVPMEVKGKGGKSLHDVWGGDARAYLGLTLPGYPNFFIMYGPNTNIVVNGSIIFFSECEANYIVSMVKTLQDKKAKAFEVKQDVFDTFNAEVDAANAEMPWGYAEANTWYRNAHGRVAQNWPFRLIDYWNRTRAASPADYTFS
ncbi:MAG: NAD(P)/FAD-dependent oxidoreductase [Hyphomonas sp.]